MKKIGIDLGSASLGWSINENNKITKSGVVVFKTGMAKGSSGNFSSPASERRECRQRRHSIEARKYRKQNLMKLLVKNNMIPVEKNEFLRWQQYRKNIKSVFPENENLKRWMACDFSYQNGVKYKNPYLIRVAALDRKLTPHEFGRALYHIVQRRGYKNIGESDAETQSQIDRRNASGFNDSLQSNRTLAEALLNDYLSKGKRARNEYPFRNEYADEIFKICKRQGYDVSLNENNSYVNDFMRQLSKYIIWQRPLKSQKGNIGRCTLEIDKNRCSNSHPVFEIFRALEFINSIKIIDEDHKKCALSKVNRNFLFLFFLKQKSNFKFEKIREKLDKHTGVKNRYNYPFNVKTQKYDTTVSGMPFCAGMIKIFGSDIIPEILNLYKYNNSTANKIKCNYSLFDFWHLLHSFDDRYVAQCARDKLGIADKTRMHDGEEIQTNPLVEIQKKLPSGFSNLSLKAIRNILPFLFEGYIYSDAVALAKLPKLYGDKWESIKEQVISIYLRSKENYHKRLTVLKITNKLIEDFKSAELSGIEKNLDFKYKLQKNDIDDIKKKCEDFFGKESWSEMEDSVDVVNAIKIEYQLFFQDLSRNYRKSITLMDEFKNNLHLEKLEFNGHLYHHSVRSNRYGESIQYKNYDTGQVFDILPVPLIPSIKNPMFNKAMSVLRRLLNQLILDGYIDERTKVIVEIPRGKLEDNNERIAYNKYIFYREKNRDRIRTFLEEYSERKNVNFNIDKKISVFELWNEQRINNDDDILFNNDTEKRYKLWMEQNGQCMYTGKMISIAQLFSSEIDIDHTIPRSVLLDDTMANKTVCFKHYNEHIKEERLPYYCPNYDHDDENGTAIKLRLQKWEDLRDFYKNKYLKNKTPLGKEDIDGKNKRIQEKFLARYNYEYWKDKIERFTAKEVPEGWARRQLADTRVICKYAREFLSTTFQSVSVVNGNVTAVFRELIGLQKEENKNRDKHSHHAIDAATLTFIPSNGASVKRILKQYYCNKEQGKKSQRFITLGMKNFSPNLLRKQIEEDTLIVHYSKDKLLQQTYKYIRKRGKLQYLKRQNKLCYDSKGNRIKLMSRGDTIRTSLFKDTFIGKIKDIERNELGKPKRSEDGKFVFKKGDDEFLWVTRKEVRDILNKTDKIVDPVIRQIVETMGVNAIDPQGKKIRRVRIETIKGRIVKERLNYKSKSDYKNYYYAASNSIPYALILEQNHLGELSRRIIEIGSCDVARIMKIFNGFNIKNVLKFYNLPQNLANNCSLLKTGQMVLFLNSDEEYEMRHDADFQAQRLYKITQFYDSGVYLKHHSCAKEGAAISLEVKERKSGVLDKYEKKHGLDAVIENDSISDNDSRQKDFLIRKYSFNSLNDFRLKRLVKVLGQKEVQRIKRDELSQFSARPSKLFDEGITPLLKLNIRNCNFLYSESDFDFSILGEITFYD